MYSALEQPVHRIQKEIWGHYAAVVGSVVRSPPPLRQGYGPPSQQLQETINKDRSGRRTGVTVVDWKERLVSEMTLIY